MFRRLFLLGILSVTVSSPLVAFAESAESNSENTPVTLITVDSICNQETLGVSENGSFVELEPVWEGKHYNCSAGYYLNSKTFECAVCKSGSYCTGFNAQFDGKDGGINSCPDGYTSVSNTDKLAKTEQDCYKNVELSCAEKKPYTGGNGTAVYVQETVSCTLYSGSEAANESVCATSCRIDHLNCAAGYTEQNDNGVLTCVESGIRCEAGKYILQGSGKCDAICPENSYCPGGLFTVSNANESFVECPSGLKSPKGSKSENSCGKILRIDGEALYLHRNKSDNGHPSLVIQMEDGLWYADAEPIEKGETSINPDSGKKLHMMFKGKEYTVHTKTEK